MTAPADSKRLGWESGFLSADMGRDSSEDSEYGICKSCIRTICSGVNQPDGNEQK